MKLLFRALVGENDWGWVMKQVPILQNEDTTGIVAVDTDTDELVGACIMDNFTASSVQCHFMITSPMVLKHDFLEEIFNCLFNTCDKRVIYGLVPADNTKALQLNAHMGFTEKCRLEGAWKPDVDYVLMEMKKADCKYLPNIELKEASNG